MPTESHGRNLPAGSAIAKLLRRVWQRQEQETFAALRMGHLPDLNRWNGPLAQFSQPLFLSHVGDGGHDALKRIRKLLERGPRRGSKHLLGQFLRPTGQPGRLEVGEAFDLFNPHVMTAVQQAVLQFAASTNATTTLSVMEAREEVRTLIGRGYSEGETNAWLIRRIGEVFNDRARARSIGLTESSRAVHMGQVLAAKETGIVKAKRWLTSSAHFCELCESLDGKVVGLDDPFYVNPKGGPYAVVYYAPAHPHCRCTWLEVIDWDAVGRRAA